MTWRQIIRKLNRAQVMGQLRHMLNTTGAALAMHGVVAELAWELYTGLALAVLAFVGSLIAREKKAGPG